MKNWKKLALIAGGVIVLLAIVGFTVEQSRKGVVTVQTGKVVREDLAAVVTASGEIKPKVQGNIGSQTMAKITHLYVKEGDRVKKGEMLAVKSAGAGWFCYDIRADPGERVARGSLPGCGPLMDLGPARFASQWQ